MPPLISPLAKGKEIDAFHGRGVLGEIGFSEKEETEGGFQSIFFKMNEGSGELNQSFIKIGFGAFSVDKPEFLQNIVGFVVELLIEAFEIAEVVWIVVRISSTVGNEGGDLGRFFAHPLDEVASL